MKIADREKTMLKLSRALEENGFDTEPMYKDDRLVDIKVSKYGYETRVFVDIDCSCGMPTIEYYTFSPEGEKRLDTWEFCKNYKSEAAMFMSIALNIYQLQRF